MRRNFGLVTAGLAVLVLTVMAGCSDSNPISAFQPEIINDTDAFEFQITDARNVSTTLTYSWVNTGAQASVDHSTALDDGVASVVLRDANGTQVYSSGLKASGTEQSLAGTSGAWSVVVTFSNFDGTSNFRLQKL